VVLAGSGMGAASAKSTKHLVKTAQGTSQNNGGGMLTLLGHVQMVAILGAMATCVETNDTQGNTFSSFAKGLDAFNMRHPPPEFLRSADLMLTRPSNMLLGNLWSLVCMGMISVVVHFILIKVLLRRYIGWEDGKMPVNLELKAAAIPAVVAAYQGICKSCLDTMTADDTPGGLFGLAVVLYVVIPVGFPLIMYAAISTWTSTNFAHRKKLRWLPGPVVTSEEGTLAVVEWDPAKQQWSCDEDPAFLSRYGSVLNEFDGGADAARSQATGAIKQMLKKLVLAHGVQLNGVVQKLVLLFVAVIDLVSLIRSPRFHNTGSMFYKYTPADQPTDADVPDSVEERLSACAQAHLKQEAAENEEHRSDVKIKHSCRGRMTYSVESLEPTEDDIAVRAREFTADFELDWWYSAGHALQAGQKTAEANLLEETKARDAAFATLTQTSEVKQPDAAKDTAAADKAGLAETAALQTYIEMLQSVPKVVMQIPVLAGDMKDGISATNEKATQLLDMLLFIIKLEPAARPPCATLKEQLDAGKSAGELLSAWAYQENPFSGSPQFNKSAGNHITIHAVWQVGSLDSWLETSHDSNKRYAEAQHYRDLLESLLVRNYEVDEKLAIVAYGRSVGRRPFSKNGLEVVAGFFHALTILLPIIACAASDLDLSLAMIITSMLATVIAALQTIPKTVSDLSKTKGAMSAWKTNIRAAIQTRGDDLRENLFHSNPMSDRD
jgi:hypothetical protein